MLKTQTPGIAASDEKLLAFYARIRTSAGSSLSPGCISSHLRAWRSSGFRRVTDVDQRQRSTSERDAFQCSVSERHHLHDARPCRRRSDVCDSRHHRAVRRSRRSLLARQFPQYGASLLLVFAMRMAAMFVLTTTNLGRLSGILPKWFIVMGFAVAIGLLLTASSAHGSCSSFRPGFWSSAPSSSIAPGRSRPISSFQIRASWSACNELPDREAPVRPRQFHQNVLTHEEPIAFCPWKLLAPVRRHDSDWEYSFCRMLLRPSFR